jgi:hypothetical protein
MIPCAVNQSRSKACKFPLSPSIFHICGARLPLSISHAMDVSLHENQSRNTSFLSLPLFWCDETGVMKENRTMMETMKGKINVQHFVGMCIKQGDHAGEIKCMKGNEPAL